MMDTLQVEKRDETGSLATRRLRRTGRVPAVLYGHGQDNQHLSIAEKEIKLLLRHRAKMVQLKGAVDETALVSEMQWDPLGIDILHLDLVRVDLKEKVAVTVPVRAQGDPVGVKQGGMYLQNMHQVDIRCPAGSIPEAIHVNVSGIQVGDSCTAKDLPLPEGSELVTSADAMVAHVEPPRGATKADIEAARAGTAFAPSEEAAEE